jgi:hypothetical protein
LKGDDKHALDLYDRTVKLAPNGFFTALTAVYYLRLEAAEKIPRGTYRDYLSLEWEERRQLKRERLEALTKAVPAFAPAWKDLAPLLEKPAEPAVRIGERVESRSRSGNAWISTRKQGAPARSFGPQGGRDRHLG